MASEYLKWKYRDVKPDEPIRLTRKEKALNWWHYHKWYVLLGSLLLGIVGSLVKSALHIGEIRPDYQFAYVGSDPLPADTVAALESALAEYGEDCNGDGSVIVRLNQYTGTGNLQTDNSDTAYYAYASNVTLMADLEDCESYFFILQKYETFQANYAILRHLDGTMPEDGLARDERPIALQWSDCPVLAGLELGAYSESVGDQEISGDSQELLSGLYFARRGFWTDKTADNAEGCDALWDELTRGAVLK